MVGTSPDVRQSFDRLNARSYGFYGLLNLAREYECQEEKLVRGVQGVVVVGERSVPVMEEGEGRGFLVARRPMEAY